MPASSILVCTHPRIIKGYRLLGDFVQLIQTIIAEPALGHQTNCFVRKYVAFLLLT
ncbi:hypothetical protein BaRGS_00015328, partial [Batillaria attramentaria]